MEGGREGGLIEAKGAVAVKEGLGATEGESEKGWGESNYKGRDSDLAKGRSRARLNCKIVAKGHPFASSPISLARTKGRGSISFLTTELRRIQATYDPSLRNAHHSLGILAPSRPLRPFSRDPRSRVTSLSYLSLPTPFRPTYFAFFKPHQLISSPLDESGKVETRMEGVARRSKLWASS